MKVRSASVGNHVDLRVSHASRLSREPSGATGWLAQRPIDRRNRLDGSVSRVADKAGMERTHLYRKLKQLGVDLGKGKRSA
mgnify:CR=1 FL=1